MNTHLVSSTNTNPFSYGSGGQRLEEVSGTRIKVLAGLCSLSRLPGESTSFPFPVSRATCVLWLRAPSSMLVAVSGAPVNVSLWFWTSVLGITPHLSGPPASLLQEPWMLFSHSVMSDSLRLHGLPHARLPCPSLSPRACSNSCPLSQWCHPTISSSVVPFSSCLQSFPASGSFSNESSLRIRWSKYWSFSISPPNEYSGLVSTDQMSYGHFGQHLMSTKPWWL